MLTDEGEEAVEIYLTFANERHIELLKKSGIECAEDLGSVEPESLVVKLAETNIQHNLTYWLPGQEIVRIWVSQAKQADDRRALLLPGRPGGGGVKLMADISTMDEVG